MAVGVYPGSFDPPTVAHLAVAEAARDRCGLARVDLSLSLDALGKAAADQTPVAERRAVLEAVAETRPWLGVVTTRARLLAEIAAGYDVVVLGADKWAQLLDPAWYGSAAARDAALAELPLAAVAPRPPDPLPDPTTAPVPVVVLEVDTEHHPVSATAVRHHGRTEWMLPEAAAHARRTGRWLPTT